MSGRVVEGLAEGSAAPFVIQLYVPGQHPTSLSGFDEIWVEYSGWRNAPICQVDVAIALTVQSLLRPREEPISIEASTERPALTVVSADRPRADAWKRKDLRYLAARFLGTEPDDLWRFSGNGSDGLVVQRRWNQQIHDVVALELAFGTAALPSRVNVVVRNSHHFAREVLSFPIAAGSHLPGGRPGARLRVIEALEQRRDPSHSSESAGWPILEELIVFFPTLALEHTLKNPITEVSFLKAQYSTGTVAAHFNRLYKEEDESDSGVRRAVVRLTPLTAASDASLGQANLILKKPLRDGGCAMSIEAVRLVNAYTTQ